MSNEGGGCSGEGGVFGRSPRRKYWELWGIVLVQL